MCEEFEQLEMSVQEENEGQDPHVMDTQIVTRMCLSHGLPILTPQQCDAARGTKPALLGEGGFGRAYLNEEEGLVVKDALDREQMPSVLTEAKAMMLLQGIPRVQRLVGICPEQLSLVSKYGGPTLKKQLASRALSFKQRALIAMQLAETV